MAEAKGKEKTAAERQAEADAADAETRKHGLELAQRAAAVINQPLRPPLTLARVCEICEGAGEKLVVVAINKPFLMHLDFKEGPLLMYCHERLQVPAGPHQMPSSLLEHWWVKAQGVKPYVAPPPTQSERDRIEAEVNRRVAEELEKQKAKK